MKKIRPSKGFKRPVAQRADGTPTGTPNGTPHRNSGRKPIPKRAQPTTMENKDVEHSVDEEINSSEVASEEETEEVSATAPDELREQLRELTQKNCLAALQEIEQILERRGLRMYPIVHVEGNAIIHSTIAIVPK